MAQQLVKERIDTSIDDYLSIKTMPNAHDLPELARFRSEADGSDRLLHMLSSRFLGSASKA